MLDRRCFSLLKTIRSFSPDGTQPFKLWFDQHGNLLSFGTMTRKIKFSSDPQNLAAFQNLVSEGCVAEVGKNLYRITYKGMYPFKFSAHEVAWEVIRSVVFPFIVAALGTLFTLWLKGQL